MEVYSICVVRLFKWVLSDEREDCVALDIREIGHEDGRHTLFLSLYSMVKFRVSGAEQSTATLKCYNGNSIRR